MSVAAPKRRFDVFKSVFLEDDWGADEYESSWPSVKKAEQRIKEISDSHTMAWWDEIEVSVGCKKCDEAICNLESEWDSFRAEGESPEDASRRRERMILALVRMHHETGHQPCLELKDDGWHVVS